MGFFFSWNYNNKLAAYNGSKTLYMPLSDEQNKIIIFFLV